MICIVDAGKNASGERRTKMILADKIISLRKKEGWSQEELAQQLNVTRQSVSKWEGAQSVPDIEKILQMSRIFGVTTDFLLKDEMEFPEAAEGGAEEPLRRVTMEEASAYLELRQEAAPKMAVATFLCIVSPVALMLLAALSEFPRFHITENVATGVGLSALLLLVAAGVSIFLACAAKVKAFEFLEKENFETEYGVTGMVRERMKAFEPTYNRLNITGTLLCILAVVPLFAAICFDLLPDLMYVAAMCLLLVIVGLGCVAFVYGGTIHSAMEKLLEEGDYTRAKKARTSLTGAVSVCYWLLATAVYLYCTFGPSGNGNGKYTWYIWAIAGVLYGALMAVLKTIEAGKTR